MRTFRITSALYALAIAVVTATPSQAQPAQTVQAALSKEAGSLSDKFTGAGAAGGGRPAPITHPEKLQEALKTSYANVQQTIAGLSEADLKAPVKVFGRDFTKEEAVRYLFADQHEHLGQSIAYARTNGGVPPWSK